MGPRMSDMPKFIPVIMCGGAGTRLWPVSRDSMPKQFISLFGGESTFQRVMRLIKDAATFGRPIVITNAEYRFTVQEQLAQTGVDAEIVLEPMRRDSAAAVAAAVELAALRDPEAIVGVFAADHVVQDGRRFIETCEQAARVAAGGRIVTIGIPPTGPATGYGYMQPGEDIGGGGRRVEAFVEKPDATRAARYLLEGYLWNSGNFIFPVRLMRQELQRLAPDVAQPVVSAVAGAERDLSFLRLDGGAFGKARAISIDYAVMEQTDRAAVVVGDFGWSDVGGWGAVWELSDRDTHGNAIQGRGYVLNGKDNLIRSEEGVVAVIGLDGVAVISTRDATLVVPRDQAARVKDMVALIASRGDAEAAQHREIQRPWGKYLSIDMGGRHQVKRITVKPGGILSLQKHYHRAEHWVVVRGTAEVTRNNEILVVHENESVYLPIGAVHRMANPGKIALELIEVQVGSYLGEDDIVRIEDIYRRV